MQFKKEEEEEKKMLTYVYQQCKFRFNEKLDLCLIREKRKKK